MVKARFPGKPSKIFNRRKVSGVNSENNEELNAAEDVYRRLSLFYSLFPTEDEDKSFHGFSPHEDKNNKKSVNQKTTGKSNLRKKRRVHFSPRKLNNSKINGSNSPLKDTKISEDNSNISPSSSDSPVEINSKKEVNLPKEDSPKKERIETKDKVPSNPTLSGKFVLPSRSIHSSRVIKPNKRFLHNDISSVPCKKSKLSVSSDLRDPSVSNDNSRPKSEDNMPAQYSSKRKYKKAESSGNSPVKFVLRKPRLKIKTQPLPNVGGPFSSPSGNNQGLKYQSPSVSKVVCGVCGCLRTFVFFKQARKFGIFSCDPCRKFILRMIRSERDRSLQPLSCTSGNGNCQIRQNTLVAQFSSEPEPDAVNERQRCEACWLYLCLRCFHMPQKLIKRLSVFLPPQFSQKPIVTSNKCLGADWREVSDPSGESFSGNSTTKANPCETKILRRNKGARENINIRRGSNTSLRLSSHRNRSLRGDIEEVKRGRGRQKLPAPGPRVKHVCRSASLVLGQPVATFHPNGSTSAGTSPSNNDEIQPTEDIKITNSSEFENPIQEVAEKTCVEKPLLPDPESPQDDNSDIEFPPIARMLQDLGRANCELLDGVENHEFERQNARVSIDFWESYDPEEVSQMGFPLIGFNPLKLRALCFLCGSAGHEKMIHCANCCEPYHTFCVSNVSNNSTDDWWRLDWLCPKCTLCEACLKTGGTQLSCTKCLKSYHSSCVAAGRVIMSDNNWVCPSCLFCKSCNDTSVHVFVGNMPLCKTCFKLRKKGNFCPLCQCCYDDNDYNTKMMECAVCKQWIHAQCEGISNEKYQVLSYLPSSIEFICRLCCKKPPAPWSCAVSAELRAGYLNVIKILSKNKNACAMFKASPKKQRVCVCSDTHRNPIHLPNLISSSESDSYDLDSPAGTSPDRDFKSSDLGLLTPKLTKDDEESLKSVKTDFLTLVTDKNGTKDFTEQSLRKKTEELLSTDKNTQLLSIAYDKLGGAANEITQVKISDKSIVPIREKQTSVQERVCTCKISEPSVSPPTLSLLSIKIKATNDEYHSVLEFHNDMEAVTKQIGNPELIETYHRCLKQIFPWFDSSHNDESGILESSLTDRETEGINKNIGSSKREKNNMSLKENFSALKGLLNLDPHCYYIGMNLQETRTCLLCKSVGEGLPMQEGRLLYCGHNEWVHINCALWSSEVFEEIDGSLQNVHSAISRARLIRCMHCGKKGASVGCCAKSCPSAYHFSCALSAECVFLESKEVFCKTHESMRGDKGVHRDEDFLIKRPVYVELEHKKRKDVLRNQVRIYIGSLEVTQIGEIIPELSDDSDVIIPCEYECSRLYWSWKEPWKVVRYFIQTKVSQIQNEYSYENDTNYTVDHSLEFTPPPSPVESIKNGTFSKPEISKKDIRAVINQMIETICLREEEGNLSDQQNTDLLPPELTDVIFDELPKDFLDRITVHDIFTKIPFDDILSDSKSDKVDIIDSNILLEPRCNNKLKSSRERNYKTSKERNSKTSKERNNKTQNNIFKVVKMKECQVYLDRDSVNKWKRSRSIIQVDGAMDLSESEQSNDSSDVDLLNEESTNDGFESTDEPVKCSRCHRTYRTSLSYERHVPNCTTEFLSGSESDLSEEEKTQSSTEENIVRTEVNVLDNMDSQIATSDSQIQLYNVPVEVKSIVTNEHKIQTLMQNSFENSLVCVNNQNYNGIQRDNTESLVSINYASLNNDSVQSSFPPEQTIVTSVDAVVSEPVMGLQQPTFILQQMPSDNVLPQTYLPPYQDTQQPNIQYITAINTQEKAQYLTANSLAPTTYHIQPQLPQQMVQNVPTVVGTILQPNGVEQLVLNNPGPSLDMYGHQQNNMFITNTPMIVGMETVVSNTVMSSSRFITGTPGMMASSYSATTTQVFQAAKPVMDIPQSYVVVNTNSPMIENNAQCLPSIIQNGSIANQSWGNYKVNYPDSLKLNKNITYQTMAQQIVSQKQQDINGMKMLNSNEQQTLLVAPMPVNKCNNMYGSPAVMEKCSNSPRPSASNQVVCNNSKSNHLVKVELPSSSAIHKEKPQQAVAPVVIKQVSESPRVERPFQTLSCIVPSNTDNKVDTSCQLLPVTPNNAATSSQESIQTPPTDTISSEEGKPSHNNENCSKKTTETSTVTDKKSKEPRDAQEVKVNGNASMENAKKKKVIHEEPRISFEITSEDGFSFNTTSLDEAWNKVYETVQKARKAKNLPPLTQNPFSSPDTMLKKLMGLGNNSMKYLLEQLPGIGSCSKYKPIYHKKPPSALEKELYNGKNVNTSGCARTEIFKHTQKTYDMFSWLASRHRRPPKLLFSDNDGLNGNSRRATSMNLPMAMRFRHLKETSKLSVGVFRSDIHGRGLFCLRDIDSGEMVIEYAGEVIRSALTDKRERYYTEKGIGCYMFRIDDKFVVDATMKGNAARFINHSCEPNCYSRVIDILGKKHILIFALRKILQGEELTYDYKFPLEEDKINCHCLSRKCRKYLN